MSKSDSSSEEPKEIQNSNEVVESQEADNKFYIGSHSKMLSSGEQRDDDLVLQKYQSFSNLDKSKVQLTWKNVTISAPPMRRRWRRAVEGEDRVILGKTLFIAQK